VIWAAGLVGLAEGVAVGAALAALVTALDLVPHLARLTGTAGWTGAYRYAVVVGALLGAGDEVWPLHLGVPQGAVIATGAAVGVFTGMVAAALAEVIEVLPVFGRRLGLGPWLARLVTALAVGKAAGAVLWWAVPSLFHRPPAG
jgi:stage V sporulation protein AB